MRPLSTWLATAVGLGLAASALAACSSDEAATDAGVVDATVDALDLCGSFTDVGSPCPQVSPLRCFAQCEAGGCYCTSTPSGPRWTCQSDFSCVPDCAPMDDGCAPVPTGDDGPGDDGTAPSEGGGPDGGDSGDAPGADAADAADAAMGDAGAG
ncbi:MAG TPA: hypothetical protein VIF15_05325 [Polyangiaceae bacterium]|jgi:hypothetical protein